MARAQLATMAWRNLWRQPRRTFLTLSSIAFGTFFAAIFTGVGDANWKQMIDLAARLGGGHVSLQHSEYRDSPTLSHTVHGSELLPVALADPDVRAAVPRISGQLMLSTAEKSYGAGFIAFDPTLEDVSTLSLLDAVSEGQLFDDEGRGIVLGARLAENLGARLGRKVVFTLTDRHGEIVRDVERVSGILETGAPSVDRGLVLLPLDRMRQVLGYDAGEVVQVAVFLSDQRAADRVAARLPLADVPEVSALAWHVAQPDLASFIAMKVAGARFMEGIILLLVAAGIFNTLFVSVMERMREFGILSAIGFSPARLFGMVMFESLWLAAVGLVLAVAVTAGPFWYLATTGVDIAGAIGASGSEVAGVALPTRMYASLYAESALQIAVAVIAATLLSGVYPAIRAGRVNPVETIRLV